MNTVTKMKLFDVKKHSVRYNAVDPDPAITSIYVMKPALPTPFPEEITITVEAPSVSGS